jgi:A/G-specific adenine glycosylase
VSDFGSNVPATVNELLTLPGIGRYTAGAISSIAFEKRSPILDGNVARVLCRVDAIQTDPREPSTRELLWRRAEEILPKTKIGDFNSAMMELGALICIPRSPQCLLCPVRMHCEANAQGLQEKIPPPKASKPTPLFTRWTFCIRHGDRYLVEQRPASGRWASMWQFATIEAGKSRPSAALLRSQFSLRTDEPVLLGKVEHSLTHRRYRFDVFSCDAVDSKHGQWATLAEMDKRPLPKPHVKILGILAKK